VNGSRATRLESSESDVIRGIIAWGPAALWAAVLFLLSGISDVPSPPWLPMGDKLGHFCLYAVLGAALAWGRSRAGAEVPHGVPISGAILFALSDEWHQAFVPGRFPSSGDLLADALGALTGYLVSFLLVSTRGAAKGGLSLRSPG